MSLPLRLLIVEDDEGDAELIVNQLRHGGYEPTWERVDTAPALTAALRRQVWDIITCDWVMPQFSGPRALAVILESDIDVPVVVISGQIGEEYAVTALRGGAHDVVSKSRLTRLVPAIERELQETEVRRARRRAEEALRGSEERYRSLAVVASEILWTTDARGEVKEDLPLWRAFTGQDVTAILERGWLDAVHADDRDRARREWSAAVRQQSLYQTEYRLRRRDGVYCLVAVRGVPVLDKNGLVREWVGTCTDITERRGTITEAARLSKELEDFLHAVSHDLRAPLRHIEGFSQMLIDRFPAGLPPEAVGYVERIRAATGQMGRMIEAMLSLSRLMRHNLAVSSLDLTQVAQAIADELMRSEPHREVEFVIAPGMKVEGDATLLRSLLQQLLGNAWKFTSRHPAARIEVGKTEADGGSVFFVRDDGAGFDMAYADKLFGAFQRLHSTSQFEGIGIGLATVQRIVHRHGGRVWAEAAVEQGATFYFTLSEADTAGESAAAKLPSA